MNRDFWIMGLIVHFQLPLSGSLAAGGIKRISYWIAFNSLSRDHTAAGVIANAAAIRTFNSLSRDHTCYVDLR